MITTGTRRNVEAAVSHLVCVGEWPKEVTGLSGNQRAQVRRLLRAGFRRSPIYDTKQECGAGKADYFLYFRTPYGQLVKVMLRFRHGKPWGYTF